MAPIPLEEVAERVRQHPRLIFADDFEIALESTQTRSSRYQNGALSGESADNNFWLSLRVLHRKAPGSAVVGAWDDDSITRLVEGAFGSAGTSTGDPWFRFPIWKKVEGTSVAPDVALPESALWSGEPAGVAFVEERYETRRFQTLIRRKTERACLKGARSCFAAHFSAACAGPRGLVMLREERSNKHGPQGMAPLLKALAEDAVSFSSAEVFERAPEKTSVLFSPAVASALLTKLSPWFHADRLRHRRSPLKAQDPKHLFSPVLTFADVGNHPESPHSLPFDYEGTATRETTLVERGALKNLFFDTYEATRENRLSTGNWLRAPGAPWPSIQPSTCYFKPSEQRVEALLKEAREGIWVQRVESLEALGEGSTRFELSGCGRTIEGGAAGSPRRGISLQFDAFELLRKAVGVGSDLALFGNHGSPSILFEKVPLGEV
jgi:predicted Zn-dependent protease